MEEQKTRGLLLHAIPYLGKKKILKILTAEYGLISVFAKSNTPPSLCSPFFVGEWVYHIKQSDLYLLQDGCIIDDLSHIRNNYRILMSAGTMAQSILSSQQNGKPSPKLYQLAVFYLEQLKTFPKPEILSLSFQVKLLQHEGSFHYSNTCITCGEKASYLSQGESTCAIHRGQGATFWTESEWQALKVLGGAKRLSELAMIEWTESLHNKIGTLFSLHK